MSRTALRLLGLGVGALLLLTVQASATPCSDLCSIPSCEAACYMHGGCYGADPTVRCGGRQAYCINTCQDETQVTMLCSDACYVSGGGGGGGGGSPVFARKPTNP